MSDRARDWPSVAAEVAFQASDEPNRIFSFPVAPGDAITVEKSITIRGPSSSTVHHGDTIVEKISAATLAELYKESGKARVCLRQIRVSTGMQPLEPVVVNLELQRSGEPNVELFANGVVNPSAPGDKVLTGAVIPPRWSGELPGPAYPRVSLGGDVAHDIGSWLRTVGIDAMYSRLSKAKATVDGYVSLPAPPPTADSFDDVIMDNVDKALVWWLIHGAHRYLADDRAKAGSSVTSPDHVIYTRTFGQKNAIVVHKQAALKYIRGLASYFENEHHIVVGSGDAALVCALTKATRTSWSQVLVPGACNAVTLHIKGEVWPTHPDE